MAQATEQDVQATEADFREVTKELGPDELKHLFHELDISQRDIEHAEKSADTTDTRLKAYKVLTWWKKTKGRDATFGKLLNAKKKVLERSPCEEDPSGFNLKECQDQLRELYLGPEMKVQLTPWDPEHTVDMDAIFVNLELIKDEVSASQTKQVHLERNEDLVTLKTSNGRRVNRVLIQGETGSGKSTLLNNIAYEWALQLEEGERDSSLSQFDLVFIISVQEIVDRNNTFEDIIFNQILEEGTQISKADFRSYILSNSQKCLFLVDGLDEDSSGILSSETSEVAKLLYNKMFRSSCVIASTRPDMLKNMDRNLGLFTKVKLTGLSDENIEKYIYKYFPEDELNCKKLLEQLLERPHIWCLACTPLLLLFFCLLWADPIQAKKKLPDTRTKVYHETFASLWKRYHYEKEGLSEEDIADKESCSKLKSFLNALGQVTLDGLLNQNKEKVLFKDSDFEKTILSLALRVGILTRERIRSKLHSNNSVKFLHTSFQDFCSAVYLANLQNTDSKKCDEYVAKLLNLGWTPWGNRSSEVLIFCAGCNSQTTQLITRQMVEAMYISKIAAKEGRVQRNPEEPLMQVVCESITPSEIAKKETATSQRVFQYENCYIINILFILVFEAQLTYKECNELVRILASPGYELGIVRGSELTEKHFRYHFELLNFTDTKNGLLFSVLSSVQFPDTIEITPHFYCPLVVMLGYTKQLRCFHLKFKCPPKGIPVYFPSLSDALARFPSLFDALARLAHLEVLILERAIENSSENDTFDITSSVHKICHLKLQKLKLTNMFVTATSMAEFLHSNKSLKYFCINAASGSITNDAFTLMRAISRIQTLTILILEGVTIGRAVKCLRSIIPQLIHLTLGYPFLDERDIHELANCLGKAKALKEFNLSGNYPGTAMGMGHLADQLKHMINLNSLTLNDNDLDNPEALILVNSIKTMTTLRRLDLSQNLYIRLEGRRAIENLRNVPHLKDMEIILDDPLYRESQLIKALATSQFQPEVREFLDNPGCCSLDQVLHDSHEPKSMGNVLMRAERTLEISQESESTVLPPCHRCCFNDKCAKPETEIPGGLKKCTRCKSAVYCSKNCQTEHWRIHRSTCSLRSSEGIGKDKKDHSDKEAILRATTSHHANPHKKTSIPSTVKPEWLNVPVKLKQSVMTDLGTSPANLVSNKHTSESPTDGVTVQEYKFSEKLYEDKVIDSMTKPETKKKDGKHKQKSTSSTNKPTDDNVALSKPKSASVGDSTSPDRRFGHGHVISQREDVQAAGPIAIEPFQPEKHTTLSPSNKSKLHIQQNKREKSLSTNQRSITTTIYPRRMLSPMELLTMGIHSHNK